MKDALGYYAVLEIDSTADNKLIKIQYRDLAKIWHPDSNSNPTAMEHFQKLSVAYNVLKDDEQRLIYDLLCEIYSSENFPDMNNLNILKDKHGRENPLIRVIALKKVIGKIIHYDFTEDKIFCTYDQAKQEVLRYSVINWLFGWWHPKGFFKNFGAITANIRNIGKNDRDNFMLLAHNAIAYHQENKNRQALISALQALQYADTNQKNLLNRFISLLNEKISFKIPSWHLNSLRFLQLIIPFLLLVACAYPVLYQVNLSRYMKKENSITYFQKVKLNSGKEITDDVVVSKIFSIPVDLSDNGKLYHLSEDTNIMYGPDYKFDIKVKGQKGQTVRITGFTTDKKWYRIMIDNGEMGFVPYKALRRGIDTKPPFGSKIILQ